MASEFDTLASANPRQDGPEAVRNSLLIWPLALAISGPIALVLLWSCPFDVVSLGAPLLLLIWGWAAIAAVIVAIYAARHRAWRRAASAVILPLVVIIALANLGTLWMFAIEYGELMHFKLMRANYEAQVRRLPTDKGPRLALFDWGGFVVGHGVVYDESDEIALPANEQSAAWKARIAETELACGVWGAPVGDHFYIVRIGC